MTDIRNIDPGKYNQSLAKALKDSGDFPVPDWSYLVKSGPNKQRPTSEPDFWYKRAASILRQLYFKKTIGVNRLRSRYGGRKDRGMEPPKFVKSGGKIIRLMLQQAEKSGLVEKSKGKKAGRQLTIKGKELLESIT